MLLLVGFGLFFYCAIAFGFFALSVMELSENGRAEPAQFVVAFASAAVWPLTVLVMTFVVCIQRMKNA